MEIKTEHFAMTLADMSDLPELESIEKECDKYFLFDPPCENNHSCTVKECLTKGDIPPGGKRENYYFYGIRQDHTMIGFLAYYLEYGRKETAYLSVLYIKEEHRKHGVGTEILDALVHKLTDLHMKEIRLHVSLRNALALQFWVRNGFDRIVSVECNGNLSQENFGGIELTKSIP